MTNLAVISDRSALMTARKNAIKRLLDEPLFTSAVEEIKRDILVEWAMSKADQIDLRENLHVEIVLIEKVIDRLTAYANDVNFTMKKKDESDAT